MNKSKQNEVRICGVLIGYAASVSLQGYRMSFAGFVPEVKDLFRIPPKAKVEGTYCFKTGEFEIYVNGEKRDNMQTELVQFVYTNPSDKRATIVSALPNTGLNKPKKKISHEAEAKPKAGKAKKTSAMAPKKRRRTTA